jgi:hypothetical protein
MYYMGQYNGQGPEDDTLKLDPMVKRHIQRVLKLTGGKIHGPGHAGGVSE